MKKKYNVEFRGAPADASLPSLKNASQTLSRCIVS